MWLTAQAFQPATTWPTPKINVKDEQDVCKHCNMLHEHWGPTEEPVSSKKKPIAQQFNIRHHPESTASFLHTSHLVDSEAPKEAAGDP